LKIADLNILGKVTAAYEFQRGKVYLVLVDGKKFKYQAVANLLDAVEQEGIDFRVHVVGTLHPEAIQIHEASND